MWGTTDADYGVTYGGRTADYSVTYSGCTADIHTASSYRHPDPSAGRYGASSDRNNSCSNTHSNRNNSSCGNQAGSHRNAGTSAY